MRVKISQWPKSQLAVALVGLLALTAFFLFRGIAANDAARASQSSSDGFRRSALTLSAADSAELSASLSRLRDSGATASAIQRRSDSISGARGAVDSVLMRQSLVEQADVLYSGAQGMIDIGLSLVSLLSAAVLAWVWGASKRRAARKAK